MIEENLKIAGHDSLYNFLGLFPGASLEALQNKAVAKENEIRKIAQKDAILTASGVLVGQCIALFKSDESRYAYDLSRARLLLNKLNADIDLAVTGNTVPREQYDYLVRQAVRFGTQPEEAQKHIRGYCQSKGWKVVLPKKKINFKRYFLIAASLLIAIGLGGGAFWFIYYSQQRLENEYLQMHATASRKPTLEAQLAHFQRYLDQQEKQEYIEKAQKDIEGIRKRIEYRDLRKMQKQSDELAANQEYENMAVLIKAFMAAHPQSAHNPTLKKELDQLPNLIDNRDFERVRAIPPRQYAELAMELTYYLTEHATGAHTKEVNQMADRMATPYYRQLTRELDACEKSQQWNRCIELSEPFIGLYKDSRYAVRIKKKRDDYARNSQGQEILTALRDKAGSNADPAALEKTYRTYLAQNPYSPAREMINAELKSLQATLYRKNVQAELKRMRRLLPQSKGRFTEKSKATVFDKTTGLTWAMVDSGLETRECKSYDEAIAYTQGLKTGGHNDWRIPTAKELQRFYSGANPFNTNSAKWYWSADTIKRYSGGWVIVIDVIAPSNPGAVMQRNAGECGWVRPVRR